MKDRFGTVIYVGKARDLRRRVTSYFQPSRRLGWDPKFKALVEAIQDLDVHVVRSEPEALLLESKLIKEFHPRYNVSFRDDKRFLMLKVNLNDPIPRFTLTRFKQDDGAKYFGPFVHSAALRNTLNLIRRQFHLRGCRPLTPNERDYKHCLYGNLKFCTAPCIGNVTREQYLNQVLAACDFLSGQCEEMREQLEAEMKKAALARDYERAAMYRDAATARNSPPQHSPSADPSTACLTTCRSPWIRKTTSRNWVALLACPRRPCPLKALTSPTSAAPSPSPRWSVSKTAGPTAPITGNSESKPSRARMISPPWPRSSDGAIPGC